MREVPEVIIETVEDEQEEQEELTIEKVEEEAKQVRRKELEEYLDGLRLQIKILTEQKDLEVHDAYWKVYESLHFVDCKTVRWNIDSGIRAKGFTAYR